MWLTNPALVATRATPATLGATDPQPPRTREDLVRLAEQNDPAPRRVAPRPPECTPSPRRKPGSAPTTHPADTDAPALDEHRGIHSRVRPSGPPPDAC